MIGPTVEFSETLLSHLYQARSANVQRTGDGAPARLVDFLELALGPLDRLLGLREHVRDDVFGIDLPAQAALVAGVLPERRHPLDRIHGALAVEHDLSSRLVGDLLCPRRP